MQYWFVCIINPISIIHVFFFHYCITYFCTPYIYIFIYIYIYIYIWGPQVQDATQGQFVKQSLISLNIEFFFFYTSCHTKAKEPNLPYYLPIDRGRIVVFMFHSGMSAMGNANILIQVWIWIANSISYCSNHYTMGKYIYIYIYIYKPYYSCFTANIFETWHLNSFHLKACLNNICW